MSNHPLRMLKRGLVLSLLVLLLCPLNSRAQDICFDDATAGRMIVALEQAKISEQQLAAGENKDAESQKQIGILQGTIKLLEDRVALHESMRKTDATFSDMKDKACAEQVKAAAPSFMDKLKSNFLAGGIGAVIAAVVILLL